MIKTPFVCILILNWNGKEDTIECINSLKNIDYPNYKTIVIDNGSTDDSVKVINKIFPKIKIIKNKKNLGYAEGNNVGIRYALKNKADYVLILNNDTVVDKKFLTELVKVAESDDKIGIVGPKVCYFDKKNIINFAGGKVNLWTGKTPHIGINKETQEFSLNKEVDYIEGSCLLLKIKVIKNIGLFDKRFFCYFEDVDLCLRTKKNYTIFFVPPSKIWHKVSKSSNSSMKEYYLVRNRIYFERKNANLIQKITFIVIFSIETVLYSFLDILKRRFSIIKFRLKGIYDGFSNLQ